MRIANIIHDSIVDGPGCRLTIFTQGCPHHCKGCHNPGTWDFNSGHEVSVNEIIKEFRSNPLLNGITLSGGEPFIKERKDELLELVKGIKHFGGNIWAYSGFYVEDLSKEYGEILNYIDYIVDGPFVLEERSLSIAFRGSTNQRIMKNNDGKWVNVSEEFEKKT